MKRIGIVLIAGLMASSLALADAGRFEHDPRGGHDSAQPGESPSGHAKPARESHAKPARSPRPTVHLERRRDGHSTVPAGAPPVGHTSPQPVHAQKVERVRQQRQAQAPAYHRELKTLGVSHAPAPIQNRSHILDTDRRHSVIHLPSKGFGGKAVTQVVITRQHWNDPLVRTHMSAILVPARLNSIRRFEAEEARAGQYYWHHDTGFDYCHTRDEWGYHWYGWYVGSRYFWTRYYEDRFWFYDDAFNRWCWWANGAWWWQDPAHVTNVYLYSGERYVISNDNPSPVVSAVEPPVADMANYRSPDGLRQVKVMGDDHDAFLYDSVIPPSFEPRYLASKVKSVKFADSDPDSPEGLQIMLTLEDGSIDIFDGMGEALNFNEAAPEPPAAH